MYTKISQAIKIKELREKLDPNLFLFKRDMDLNTFLDKENFTKLLKEIDKYGRRLCKGERIPI